MTPVGRGKRASGEPKLDRRSAWREVATRTGGELVEGKRPSGDKVAAGHGPWKIWMDTYTVHAGQAQVTYTRTQAHFSGWRGMRVTVRARNVFDRLLQALGRGRGPAVSRALLEKHVVKGKPASRLPSLFMAPGLGDAILATSKITLTVGRASRSLRKRHGEELGVVTCQTTGVCRDIDRMVAMIHLTGEALDALAGIGEARREEVAPL